MTYFCRKCKRTNLTDKQMARNASRGRRLRTICKLCTAEQVKFSYRKNKWLPRLREGVHKWPLVKLQSEIIWLRERAAILREEKKRRESL